MHATDLANLANSFALHSHILARHAPAVQREAAHSLWLACRFRHEFWMTSLAEHREALQRPGISFRDRCWQSILPVMQEILISEPLTRNIACLADSLDQQVGEFDLAPLASSALTAHQEARHRCLHLIVFGTGMSSEMSARLNDLRRHMELFNDQTLALQMASNNIADYCFDALHTITAHQQLRSGHCVRLARNLHSQGLQGWFLRNCGHLDLQSAASPRLNQRLAEAVIGLWPAAMFDSFGVPQSTRMAWLAGPSPESSCVDHAGNAQKQGQPFSSPLDLLTGQLRDDQPQELSQRRWDS